MSYKSIRITIDEWTSAVDCGSGVNVIFLDFKKAFDSVPHCRMMKKLSGYGICGNLLRCMDIQFYTTHTTKSSN